MPPGFTFRLCLWCLNPAVAFRGLAAAAHSVVLTSGTLAPLEGFASEVGVVCVGCGGGVGCGWGVGECGGVLDGRRRLQGGLCGVCTVAPGVVGRRKVSAQSCPLTHAAHLRTTATPHPPPPPLAPQLATPFGTTLEAPHVVDMRRQVWAGVVGMGPGPGGAPLVVSCAGARRGGSGMGLGGAFAHAYSSHLLGACPPSSFPPHSCPPSPRPSTHGPRPRPPRQATWKNQGDPAFQDALGAVVLQACGAIPQGVLAFFPSYSLMDRLLARWKVCGCVCGCVCESP